MMKLAPFAAALAFTAISATPLAAQEQGAETSAQAPIDAESLAIAKQIVDSGFPEERREEVFFAAVDQTVLQMREASLQAYGLEDEGAIAVLDQWMDEYIVQSKAVLRAHIPSLMDGMAASYAVVFTKEELTDIAAFVSTPSGQRFMQLSPALMAEPNFAAANQAYMNEVQAQLPAAIEDLRSRIIEHLSERDAQAQTNQS